MVKYAAIGIVGIAICPFIPALGVALVGLGLWGILSPPPELLR